jgi:hypothetical protein
MELQDTQIIPTKNFQQIILFVTLMIIKSELESFRWSNPMEDRVAFSNDGEVLWYSGFGQVEYSN